MASTLDDLKLRIKELPLSDVLGRYVHIHRIGGHTKTVCPFHDDHDPSLQVNDDKGFWYCFVDQLGGDAIKFVMLYKQLDYKAALEDICNVYGWDFREYIQEKKSNPKFEMGKKILTKAAQLYKKMGETEKFPAFQSFIKDRYLDNETIKTHGLGFAPKSNALSEYLLSIPNQKEKDFAIKVAEELGIIRQSKFGENSHYDQFRERVMFPIWDQFGQTIGFTSRSTYEGQEPKYLNSIDSFLFNKRDLLYALHLAKKPIREQDSAILVEGNMDQATLFKAGFQNSLAIMGTGFRDTSASKIISYSKNIYLSFDNDQGGWGAAERANTSFMKLGIISKYVELSPYKDPDEYIQKEGTLAYQKQIDTAKPFIDVAIERVFPKEIPEVAERKLEILENLFKLLAPLGKALTATERVTSLAKRLGLQSDSATIIRNYEEFLTKMANSQQRGGAVNSKKPDVINASNLLQEIPTEENKIELPKAIITKIEKTLLQNLVQHPELLTREEISELLDFVSSNEVKEYILRLRELMYEIDESEYVSVIQNLISDDQYSLELTTTVGAAIFKFRDTNLDEKISLRMVDDIRRKLQEEQLKIKKIQIKDLQKQAQTEEENKGLLGELLEIDRQLANLKSSPRKRTPL